MKAIISHLLTACVCTSGAVVAPKVAHHIHAPVHHKAAVAAPKPRVVTVTVPCHPDVAIPVADLTAEPKIDDTFAAIEPPAVPWPVTRPLWATGPAPVFRHPGGVPDVSTWSAMVLGFGLTGAAIRRAKLKVHQA